MARKPDTLRPGRSVGSRRGAVASSVLLLPLALLACANDRRSLSETELRLEGRARRWEDRVADVAELGDAARLVFGRRLRRGYDSVGDGDCW